MFGCATIPNGPNPIYSLHLRRLASYHRDYRTFALLQTAIINPIVVVYQDGQRYVATSIHIVLVYVTTRRHDSIQIWQGFLGMKNCEPLVMYL